MIGQVVNKATGIYIAGAEVRVGATARAVYNDPIGYFELAGLAENIVNVIAADKFSNVAGGNIGEFLRNVPGVVIEYSGADPRNIRVHGMDPNFQQRYLLQPRLLSFNRSRKLPFPINKS